MAFNWLFIATLGGAFLGGVVLALLPALRTAIGQRLGIEDFWIRRLKTAFIIVLIPLLVVSGQVLDKWGDPVILYEVLAMGALLAVLGIGTVALRNTYRATLLGAGLLGAAAACLLPASTLLMPQALYDANPKYMVHALNLGYLAFGLGILLTRPVLAFLQKKCGYDKGLLVLALLALLYGGFVALPEKETALRIGKAYESTIDLPLVLACLVTLFYFPLEETLSVWAVNYLTEFGFKASSIPWVLAGFWLCFLGSRLTTGLFLNRGYEAFMLILLASAIAVTFWNLAGAGPSSGAKGMLVMWACFGPIFPTLLAIILPRAHGPATAFALLFSIGAFGSLIFQPFLGSAAPATSAQATLRLPRILALLLAIPALILGLIIGNY